MSAKQQEALFRRALSLHQGGSTESSLREALSLYTQALSSGSATLPLTFNTAGVCLSLSSLVSSSDEAASFRAAAASHLDAALSIAPTNLETLVARAAVEDAHTRAVKEIRQILSHRESASIFLRKGADAETGDADVRVLLAEALVLQAETASECSVNAGILSSLLASALPPLRQAVWLLQQRISELERMRTDPNALSEARHRLLQAHITGGKVALAEARLTEGSTADRLQEAEEAIRNNEAGSRDAEALLTRAELLESLAEGGGAAAGEALEAAIEACRMAVAAFEADAEAEQERKARGVEAYTLLGDLCLARVRGEQEQERASALVGLGTRGYEAAIRAAEAVHGRETESETFYNMACLVVLGLAKGCEVPFQERQIAELLKRAVDKGGVDAAELRSDQDLEHVRSRQVWFAKLLEYTLTVRRPSTNLG